MTESLYDRAFKMIEGKYPGLVFEVTDEDIPEKKRKYFTLGNFGEYAFISPNYKDDFDLPYSIMMKMDHPDASDTDLITAALLHEYGHFCCRFILYPNLPVLGAYILRKLSNRKQGVMPSELTTNIFVITEEFMAWVVSWFYLWTFRNLKLKHIKYGLQCWSSYLRRLPRWFKNKLK